jgi:hypothetical protein
MPKLKCDQNLLRAAQPWCVACHFDLHHPLNILFQNDTHHDDLYGDSESMSTAAVEADVVTPHPVQLLVLHEHEEDNLAIDAPIALCRATQRR